MAALSMRTKLSKKFHFHNPFTHSMLRNTYLIMVGRGALNIYLFIFLKSATLLKSQSVAAQTAKNAIFLVWTDFLPCVG
jgi:hypothetical protein